MDEVLKAITAAREEAAAHHAEEMAAIAELRSYVERIEKEANDMMSGMTDPDSMLKMAGKFFGG